jgi:hypothetical protein
MSDHDLSKFEDIAREAWEASTSIEERVKQCVQSDLLANGWQSYEIVQVCRHELPGGAVIFFVGEVLKTTFWRGRERYQSIDFGHHLVIEDGEGLIILPSVKHQESEGING